MRLKAVLICLASAAAAAVVACGDDNGANKLPDAPPGGSDSALPDTPDPPGSARLTITRDGAGVEGIDVYFQNADSSLVAKVPTDVNGVAEATVMPGGYVTVVNPFVVALGLPQESVQTFAGVQPGDQLVLSQDGRQALTSINILVNQDPSGSQYKMWATCMVLLQKSPASMPYYFSQGSGSTERPMASPDLMNCGTKTDVLIESENGSGSGVGWIFKDDVAVSAGVNVDIVDAYTATPTVTLEYTNVPNTVYSIDAQNLLATSDGVLWLEFLNVGKGGTSVSYERPAPATATQVFFSQLNIGGITSNQLIDWMPIATAPTLSLANGLLRRITAPPTFDIATATASWPEEATGEAPDLAIAAITAYRTAPGLAWTWKLAGPVTGASLQYPTLPADIAQYNLVTDDTAQIYDLTTAKVPGGYNAVRPIVLSKDLGEFYVGASGRAVVQRYLQ
jgi:hypothetical protein